METSLRVLKIKKHNNRLYSAVCGCQSVSVCEFGMAVRLSERVRRERTTPLLHLEWNQLSTEKSLNCAQIFLITISIPEINWQMKFCSASISFHHYWGPMSNRIAHYNRSVLAMSCTVKLIKKEVSILNFFPIVLGHAAPNNEFVLIDRDDRV